MTFAKRLQDLRKQAGITQPDLAKAIGGSDRTIGAWERGLAMPNSETIVKLANYFDVTTDYLLCHETLNPAPLSSIDPSFQSLKHCYESLLPTDRQKMIEMYTLMFSEAFKNNKQNGDDDE